eukprot:10820-Heterococcus_DN1.PRE.12
MHRVNKRTTTAGIAESERVRRLLLYRFELATVMAHELHAYAMWTHSNHSSLLVSFASTTQ